MKRVLDYKIIIIILLAFFLRIHELEKRFFWGTEQSASIWPIINLWETKKLTLIGQQALTIKAALFRTPFFIYLFALPLKISRFNPLSLATIYIFQGLMVILVIYWATKKMFGQKAALIAGYIYAISNTLQNYDKNTWVVTPIILLSSIILWQLIEMFRNENKESITCFWLGCLTGLGFSFHYQAAIMLIALFLLLIKINKKLIIPYLIGILLLIAPLILFYLRHKLLISNGLIKIFVGNEIVLKKSSHILGKFYDSLEAFSDLSLDLIGLAPTIQKLLIVTVVVILLVIPGLVFYKFSKPKNRFLINYYFYLFIFSLIGLIIINPSGYLTLSFYIWFMIPLIIMVWSYLLAMVAQKKPCLFYIIMIFFTLVNLQKTYYQSPGNYRQLTEVVRYILINSKSNQPVIKFINREVLAYKPIFYYQAPFFGLKFSDLSLLEQWQDSHINTYVIYNNQQSKFNLTDCRESKVFDKIIVCLK